MCEEWWCVYMHICLRQTRANLFVCFHIVSLYNSAPFNVQYCMCDSDKKERKKERLNYRGDYKKIIYT